MKAKMLTALLVTATVLLAACGAQQTTTPKPTITEFPLPHSDSEPSGITARPDGNLWFTESSITGDTNGKIGRITPAGQITEFPIPTANNSPDGITASPDGNLWFTECGSSSPRTHGQIGRITPGGQITEFPLPNSNRIPSDITAGPDGNLWFTEASCSASGCTSSQIGRITSGK